jgi:hypothetical protein
MAPDQDTDVEDAVYNAHTHPGFNWHSLPVRIEHIVRVWDIAEHRDETPEQILQEALKEGLEELEDQIDREDRRVWLPLTTFVVEEHWEEIQDLAAEQGRDETDVLVDVLHDGLGKLEPSEAEDYVLDKEYGREPEGEPVDIIEPSDRQIQIPARLYRDISDWVAEHEDREDVPAELLHRGIVINRALEKALEDAR